jgi:hypothetical protein
MKYASLALSLFGCASASFWPIPPFHKIADEIRAADLEAEELQYRVANNSAEKASNQFFIATAIKELTGLKEMMNSSIKDTLAFRYEKCVNRTSAKMPGYNMSYTRQQAMQRDNALAPGMLEAQMDALYKAQEIQTQLTQQLGECTLKCPTGSLLFLRRKSVLKSLAPEPVEVLRGVANAIYNTSESVDQMHLQLQRDESAQKVLQTLSTSIMNKLLQAKKDIAKMEEDLKACNHQPDAARVGDPVAEAMAGDTEVADEMVSVAQNSAKEAQDKVDILQTKLAECKRKCL